MKKQLGYFIAVTFIVLLLGFLWVHSTSRINVPDSNQALTDKSVPSVVDSKSNEAVTVPSADARPVLDAFAQADDSMRPKSERALLNDAKIIERRDDAPTANGVQTRVRVLEAAPINKFKYIRTQETFAAARADGSRPLIHRSSYVADRVLVRLKSGAQRAELDRINATFGAKILRKLLAPDTYLVQLQEHSSAAVEAAVAKYKAEAQSVAYAEPDYIVYTTETVPNDTNFSLLYAMRNTGQTGGTPGADIEATLAWDITTGSNTVKVGVVDTGISYTHTDLAANVWVNPGEIAGNGVDDDNNGFIDDVRGWDFYYDDNNPNDGHYHGTHCAGTIGAVGNNGLGVTGVCWNVKLVAIKFLSDGGSGLTSDAVDCVYYSNLVGCDLTSNSWGGGGFSQALQDAIAQAGSQNRLFVAAAGNSGVNNDFSPHYPSSYPLPNVISVAATDHQDGIASFSNYGLTSVHLAAPGVNIYSCYPGNAYQSLSGTSMATPHVAGVCALIKSLVPNASAATVKNALLTSVDPVPSMTGKCVSGGRLNAYHAVLPYAGPVLQLTSTSLTDLGNGDGLTNPGETISITSTIGNAGIEDAIDVVGTLSLSQPNTWVTISQNTSNFGTIASNGGSITVPNAFEIQIDPNAPTPQTVTFLLQLVDSSSNTWDLNFSVDIVTSATISGIVRLDGVPVEGVTIEYSGPVSGTTLTDSNGNYAFVAIDGALSVVAKNDGWIDSAAAVLQVPTELSQDFDFSSTTLSGTVTDAGNGDPLDLVTVSFSNEYTGDVTTDGTGYYELNLVTGRNISVSVSASRSGYLTSAPVNVSLPPSTTLDLSLGFSTIVVNPTSMTLNVDEGKLVSAPLSIGNQGSSDLSYSIASVSTNYQTTGLWHTTTHRLYGEATSFYYGKENVWNYDTGSTNSGELRFSSVQVPVQSPTLSFWQWRQTEGGTTYDKSLVQVSTNNGASWVTLLQSTLSSTSSAWSQANVSLAAYAGQNVQLRFYFDTVDSVGNNYEGWYVSDMTLNGQSFSSWLSTSPTSGTVTPGSQANLTVTANAISLAPGQYTRSLTINSNDLSSPTVQLPVTLNVQSVPILVAQSQTFTELSPSDADGYLEPGERIGLVVALRNVGHLAATGVQGVLSTSSSSVTLIQNQATFASIAAGATGNSSQLQFDVAPNTPSGTVVPFTFAVTDDSGRNWSFNFTVTVTLRYTLTGTVTDALTNQGLSGATVNVNGLLATTATNGTYSLNGIAPGSYSVVVNKTYYTSVSRTVTFDGNKVENFTLGRPRIDVTPVSVAQTLRHNRTIDRLLNINNTGSMPLTWSVSMPAQQYQKTDSDMPGGPTYQWTDIAATGTAISGLGDDNNLGPYNIGFTFPFYGQNFSTFRVCSNGFISFTSSSAALSGYQLPSTSAPENLIAWYWMDLIFTSGSSAHYKLVDPNTLVLQFKEFGHYGNSSLRVSAQVILKSDGTILIQYARADSPTYCSIGIQNSTRTSGLNIAYGQNYAKPNLAVRVAPAVDWLTLINSSGTTQAGQNSNVTLRMTSTPLTPGVYTKTLTVSSNDLEKSSVSVPVTLTVLQNVAPIAGFADKQTLEDVPLAITLPGSDSDDDPLTSRFTLQPRHGTLSGTGLNVTYTPAPGFNGSDSFVYVLNDGIGDSEPGFVTLSIQAVNDPPVNVAVPIVTGTRHPGRTLSTTNGNWHDSLDLVPGDLTYSYQWIRASSANGTNPIAIPNATTTSYQLSALDLGSYVGVRITATDNNEGLPLTQSTSVNTAFNLIENAAPQIVEAPVVTISIAEDTPTNLVFHGSDSDNDPLAWRILFPPAHGQLTFTSPGNDFLGTYVPNANYVGSDTATIELSDGLNGVATVQVDITVTAVNDAPAVLSGLTATPNPAGLNALVTFTTSVSDVESSVNYVWAFSDGLSVSTTQSSYTRRFTVPGNYLVTVTAQDVSGDKVVQSIFLTVLATAAPPSGDTDGDGVLDSDDTDDDGDGFGDDFETMMGTNSLSALSTPMNGLSASNAAPLNVQKLRVTLNFTRLNGDQLGISGTLPVDSGFKIAGTKIGVDIGGITRLFELDAKGRAISEQGSIKLLVRSKNGQVAAQNAKFDIKVSGGLSQYLAEEGLDNRDAKNVPAAIQVMIGFGENFFTKLQPQLYTAKIGKRGMTR